MIVEITLYKDRNGAWRARLDASVVGTDGVVREERREAGPFTKAQVGSEHGARCATLTHANAIITRWLEYKE